MSTLYLIGCLTYGPNYTGQFLDFHLKALLCDSNLPAVLQAGDFSPEYIIFTDQDTLPQIEQHPNFRRLTQLIPTHVTKINWSGSGIQARYDFRYSAIIALTQHLLTEALRREAVFTQFASDIIPAQGFLPKILGRLKEGHDSVLGLPWRTAFESMAGPLSQLAGALPAEVLAQHSYACLHPLWTHSHWGAPQFSRLPFCLLWNSGSGLLTRTFSVSPLLMTPYPEMLTSGRVLDADIPAMCRKPFWAHDWLEAPVIEAGFLFSYYPPFANEGASVQKVSEWARGLSPRVYDFLLERFWFPSKAQARFTEEQAGESSDTVSKIWSQLQTADRREFMRECLNR